LTPPQTNDTTQRRLNIAASPELPQSSTCKEKPMHKCKGKEWANLQGSCVACQQVYFRLLNEQYLHNLHWSSATKDFKTSQWEAMFAALDLHTYRNGELSLIYPLALAPKPHSEDKPQWNEAMNGLNTVGFWDAMCVEIATLTNQKDAWDRVP
jgi:hypothetical protein